MQVNVVNVFIHKVYKYTNSNIIGLDKEVGYPKNMYIDIATANMFLNEMLNSQKECEKYNLHRILYDYKNDDISFIFMKRLSQTESYLYTFSVPTQNIEITEEEMEENVHIFMDIIMQCEE